MFVRHQQNGLSPILIVEQISNYISIHIFSIGYATCSSGILSNIETGCDTLEPNSRRNKINFVEEEGFSLHCMLLVFTVVCKLKDYLFLMCHKMCHTFGFTTSHPLPLFAQYIYIDVCAWNAILDENKKEEENLCKWGASTTRLYIQTHKVR